MSKTQEEVIQNTKNPISKAEIVHGLRTLGLNASSKVEVHTSLSNFGYIINKEYDVIDALIEVVHQGVILMPAHTSEYSDPTYWENPPVPKEWIELIKQMRRPFDKKLFVPERIGKTSIAFLNYPMVERTNHPIVSLAVHNQTKDPSWLNHSINDDEETNPLMKLVSEGGSILFLGTDFHTCTSIHLSERYAEASVQREDKVCILENGNVVEKEYLMYEFEDDNVDRFVEIGKIYVNTYQNTDKYKQIKIGQATCTLIDAKALYDIAYDFHRNHKKITSN